MQFDQLSSAQKTTLKNYLDANAPTNTHNDEQAAAVLNALATGSGLYWVWRSNVPRVDVYRTAVAAADSTSGAVTTWEWDGYKGQSDGERDSWKEMFMGGLCDFGHQNNRTGILKIFGTTGNGGANRVHIFNVGRRRATVAESLLATEVTGAPANTGNDNVTGNRGKITNPDRFGLAVNGATPLEGPVDTGTVSQLRQGGF